MHFDEDERVMYYHPDENNQTVKSKAYKISDMRDEKKWKRPQLIKAPDNSLEMQVGKTITNVSNVVEFLKLKGLAGQQVFKALSTGGVPATEEEEEEEMDDEEKELLKQQLEEMEEDMRRKDEEYRKEQERKEQERLEREQKINALKMRLEKSKNKNIELQEKVDNLEAQNIQ